MANVPVEAQKISLIMKFDSQPFCKGDFGKCVEQQDLEFNNYCKYCRESKKAGRMIANSDSARLQQQCSKDSDS
jgi:hypothetical protein